MKETGRCFCFFVFKEVRILIQIKVTVDTGKLICSTMRKFGWWRKMIKLSLERGIIKGWEIQAGSKSNACYNSNLVDFKRKC